MVIDTSAVMAILQREPEAATFARLIEATQTRLMSTVSVLECGLLAVSRRGDAGVRELDAFMLRTGIDMVSFDGDQALVGREAFKLYGKGRHPARLNLGDCASYALSKTSAEPLLFKGGDFALTDVVPAAPA